jgi:GTP pyrophosphokinase
MAKQNLNWHLRLVGLLAVAINTTVHSLAQPTKLRRVGISNTGVSLWKSSLDCDSHWGEEELLQKIKSYMSPKEEAKLIEIAIKTSKVTVDKKEWNHIYGTACIIADLKLDATSIAASILLKTYPSSESLAAKDQFGEETHNLVTNVRSMESIPPYQHSRHDKEKYQKLLVALAQDDIRAILIKLADQTQKLRMLIQNYPTNLIISNCTQEDFSFVVPETLDVYAPLAHRLGVYTLKTEMEDMSLQLWKPNEYQKVRSLVAAREEESELYTDQVIAIVKEKLTGGGMVLANGDEPSVSGRAKSYYSIYNKMKSNHVAFGDIQDFMAFRILVDNVSQCYQALGIIYDMWKPLEGRFKDYIAQPRLNGYKSLHTTLIGHEEKPLEVQIRTREMHDIAESGIAAHWIYKEKIKGATDDAQHFQWLRQLAESVQMDGSKSEESKEKEMQGKEVFVFSPQGQLFSLAEGSSVLDFAYEVHSDLGSHCTGGKVNKRMEPLKYQLKNGDSIEIMKASNQTPKQEWLDIVKTSKARSRIKSLLKKQQLGDTSGVNLGQEMLEKAIKKYMQRQVNTINGISEYKEKLDQVLVAFQLKDEQQLFEAVAYGRITTRKILHEVFNSSTPLGRHQCYSFSEDNDEVVFKSLKIPAKKLARKSDGVVIGGEKNMMISYCRNCNPLHGEDVQGVITQGRGVKIHRLDCKYLQESNIARRLDALWDQSNKSQPRATSLEVICEDSPDILASMSKAISSSNINIGGAMIKRLSNGRSLARFDLMLSSIDELTGVIQQLQQEPDILSVKRR